MLAPGFIDCHTHYDAQVLLDPGLTPSSWHGVTTVVMGNCGFGIAPTRPAARRSQDAGERRGHVRAGALRRHPLDLRDLPEYLDAVERAGPKLNVAVMLGHTPLRLYVLGEEAAERDASEPEIEEMRRLVADALDAGAIGFASSRQAFEGNKAETRTMLPVITAFMTAHQLADVTVVADAGMISEANQHAIEDAGLSFILGTRIAEEPYAVAQWRREHPGQDLPDGQIFTQPWPATAAQKARGRRDKVIYYQYRADRGPRAGVSGPAGGCPVSVVARSVANALICQEMFDPA